MIGNLFTVAELDPESLRGALADVLALPDRGGYLADADGDQRSSVLHSPEPGLSSAYWVAVPDGRSVRCRLERSVAMRTRLAAWTHAAGEEQRRGLADHAYRCPK
ncbi:hypothetical protein SCNRRL3882_2843 [Streptomyces chartreusis NRRL 3882]|uniref:Uncharacterized protein n=1 Tax=Streptomyces chartreusis NRRL 3882 TaxID=1079985 RepID=A0A2N9B7Q6_STRCX|nr:hypothetical protein SCNRRL3882_2843 [Streptomyces chartreusis NRRL 3882]